MSALGDTRTTPIRLIFVFGDNWRDAGLMIVYEEENDSAHVHRVNFSSVLFETLVFVNAPEGSCLVWEKVSHEEPSWSLIEIRIRRDWQFSERRPPLQAA